MPRLDREFLAGMIWAYLQLEHLDFDPEDDSILKKITSEIKAEALEEVRTRLIYGMSECVITSLDNVGDEDAES